MNDEPEVAAEVVRLLEAALAFREENRGEDGWHPAVEGPRFYLRQAHLRSRANLTKAKLRAKELLWQARTLEGALEMAQQEEGD